MKTPNTLYSRLALITSVTLITGYLIASATWTSMNYVGTGDQLTATLWNTFVGNLNDLDTRVKSTASVWPAVTGGIAYTGGNVGIGTGSPGAKLDVRGNGDTLVYLLDSSDANRGLILKSGTATSLVSTLTTNSANRELVLGVDSIEYMRIKNNGNVGIGTNAPGYKLQLSTDSAAKPTSSTWTIASDRRIKKDINNFTDGLDTILALQPRTYKYNGLGGVGYDDTETHIGIVAQEVEKVAPYMVETRTGTIDGKEVSDFKTYQGHALPFILVNAIKELKKENDVLKSLVCLDHPTAPVCEK